LNLTDLSPFSSLPPSQVPSLYVCVLTPLCPCGFSLLLLHVYPPLQLIIKRS
jgi:hypothetical protein